MPKNVAIVAVHGVGIHEPRSSAGAIARLLLRIPRVFGTRYTSFSDNPIGISTAPVPDVQPVRRTMRSARMTLRDAVSADERPERDAESTGEFDAGVVPPADIRFMRDQLRDYQPRAADAVYETVRIEGKHLAAPSSPDDESSTVDANVHIYEMFWSDISRIGSGILSIFGAFYQVVIHLPYVGLVTLEEAKTAAATRPRLWDAWLLVCKWAVRCMTLLAPTLNIFMIAVGLGALTERIPREYQRAIAYTIPALIVLVLTTRALYAWKKRSLYDLFLPLALGVITYFAGRWIDGPVQPSIALVFEWWAIAAVPLTMIFRSFERNRPFAFPLAVSIYVLLTGVMVGLAVYGGQDPTRTVLGALEWLNLALLITWGMFALATLGVTILGVIVPRVAARPERRREALRAAYTARFAIALPGIAFAIVTLTISGALVAGQSRGTFAGQSSYQSVFDYPALARHRVVDDSLMMVELRARLDSLPRRGMRDSARVLRRQAIDRINANNGPAYFLRVFGESSDGLPGLIGALAVGLALFIVVWVLIPVLITEVRSPPLDTDARRDAARFTVDSTQLGTWLSTAFRWARGSGELLVWTVIVSIVGIIIAAPTELFNAPNWFGWLLVRMKPIHFGYTEIGGWVIGASAIGLYALLTRLSSIGARLRPVFGIMADVDNYLRELPADRTPRARLAERYASLLRYLCLWRADGAQPESGYDAIVIVAHSQGTVITADLLRYLHHYQAGTKRFEPHLGRLVAEKHSVPIYLMTMGCPLRQIYGQRFPDIYSWVGGASNQAGGAVTPDATKLLGVKAWINLYRSGDYVGRSVWRTTDAAADLYDPASPWKDEANARAEACVGPGAHTHYWDESAEVVALAIDSVIREVVAGRSGSGVVEPVMSVVRT